MAGYSRFAADFDSEFDPGLPIFCAKTARKQPENSQKQIRGQPADNEKAKNSQKQHFLKSVYKIRGENLTTYIYINNYKCLIYIRGYVAMIAILK